MTGAVPDAPTAALVTRTPRDATWHLRAEVGRLLQAMARMAAGDAEASRLAEALGRDWCATSPHEGQQTPMETLRAEIARRAAPAGPGGVFLPLRHAARAFTLGAAEYDAMVLALAVEVDARVVRLIARLEGGAPARPTLGLALALAGEPLDARAVASFATRPAVRDGLLELEGDGPAPTRRVGIAAAMLHRLLAVDGAAPPGDPALVVAGPDPSALARLVLPDATRAPLAKWGADARAHPEAVAPLVIAADRGGGRSAAARAAAGCAGHALVSLPVDATRPHPAARALRREARWHGALACAELVDAPDANVDWAAVWRALTSGFARPTIVTLAPALAAVVAAACERDPVVVRLESPDAAARAAMWRVLLPARADLDDAAVELLATRYRIGPSRIARAVRSARAVASRRPTEARHVTASDVEQACREEGVGSLAPLARELPLPYVRADLVVPDEVEAELDLACAWVRHRHLVMDRWGFGRRLTLGRGLTALFTGRPGTGKTMAAQVLARELGAPLLRVDLSAVVNKYIGETEKNLARVFDGAHAAGAVLFFDEAEALFGRRSEVKDAHDRYANIEVAYLLQRMEEYEGASLLATNRFRDLDEAFVRRLHVVVHFPMPGPAERVRIWTGMLETLPSADRRMIAVEAIGQAVELSGGEIRNAVLAAAVLAAAEAQPVRATHIVRAVHRELRKNGRVASAKELEALDAAGVEAPHRATRS